MKNIKNFAAILMIAGIATACASGGGEKTTATEAQKTTVKEYDSHFAVNTGESRIAWEGYKPTGQHDGTIGIASGKLKMNEGQLTGGTFTIDMNTITVLDLTDEGMNGKLTGHLKSADFFEVETYPEASFEITGIQAIDGATIDRSMEKGDIIPTHAITGNLTMKGISKSITFNARVEQTDSRLTAESNMFFLDRTEWNVQYKSKKISAKFKDDFINDEMGIRLKIVADQQMASL